ncbi:MAG: hypothetical protein AAGD25_14535 [Cyanobacteria bacterium P01_F01_bin.150]
MPNNVDHLVEEGSVEKSSRAYQLLFAKQIYESGTQKALQQPLRLDYQAALGEQVIEQAELPVIESFETDCRQYQSVYRSELFGSGRVDKARLLDEQQQLRLGEVVVQQLAKAMHQEFHHACELYREIYAIDLRDDGQLDEDALFSEQNRWGLGLSIAQAIASTEQSTFTTDWKEYYHVAAQTIHQFGQLESEQLRVLQLKYGFGPSLLEQIHADVRAGFQSHLQTYQQQFLDMLRHNGSISDVEQERLEGLRQSLGNINPTLVAEFEQESIETHQHNMTAYAEEAHQVIGQFTDGNLERATPEEQESLMALSHWYDLSPGIAAQIEQAVRTELIAQEANQQDAISSDSTDDAGVPVEDRQSTAPLSVQTSADSDLNNTLIESEVKASTFVLTEADAETSDISQTSSDLASSEDNLTENSVAEPDVVAANAESDVAASVGTIDVLEDNTAATNAEEIETEATDVEANSVEANSVEETSSLATSIEETSFLETSEETSSLEASIEETRSLETSTEEPNSLATSVEETGFAETSVEETSFSAASPIETSVEETNSEATNAVETNIGSSDITEVDTSLDTNGQLASAENVPEPSLVVDPGSDGDLVDNATGEGSNRSIEPEFSLREENSTDNMPTEEATVELPLVTPVIAEEASTSETAHSDSLLLYPEHDAPENAELSVETENSKVTNAESKGATDTSSRQRLLALGATIAAGIMLIGGAMVALRNRTTEPVPAVDLQANTVEIAQSGSVDVSRTDEGSQPEATEITTNSDTTSTEEQQQATELSPLETFTEVQEMIQERQVVGALELLATVTTDENTGVEVDGILRQVVQQAEAYYQEGMYTEAVTVVNAMNQMFADKSITRQAVITSREWQNRWHAYLAKLKVAEDALEKKQYDSAIAEAKKITHPGLQIEVATVIDAAIQAKQEQAALAEQARQQQSQNRVPPQSGSPAPRATVAPAPRPTTRRTAPQPAAPRSTAPDPSPSYYQPDPL